MEAGNPYTHINSAQNSALKAFKILLHSITCGDSTLRLQGDLNDS